MSKVRIVINGFGRIGRVFCRAIQNSNQIELVAVNDLTDNKTLAHLLKYDSVHGQFKGEVTATEKGLVINGKEVNVFAEKDPTNLPWGELGIDVVVESTGIFRTKEKAGKHITAGAKKVVISAPAKGEDVPGIVMGVNHTQIPDADVISNASCTTNCAAPMVAILDELCEIESGFITTVHAYTGDQRIHDAPHSDLRRARAAANSIIPTTTGAASAVGEVFPHLNGKLDGIGVRVPVIDGSLTELTCMVKNVVTVEELNAAFLKASNGRFKGILAYTDEPIVSCDIIGNSHSCIFDSEMTKVQGNQVQLIGWYDNEFGYSNRLVDLILALNK